MILKWLLEKLKASDEALHDERCWALLETAIRLLPPNRSGTLLGAGGILDLVQKASTRRTVSKEVFLGMTKCLNLLLDVSDAIQGASLRVILVIDGMEAARFLGLWMRQVFYRSIDMSPPVRIALRIWNLRKHHPDDNKFFSEDCLLWVTAVLTRLYADCIPTSRKRRRNEDNQMAQRSLESLIATHVILPARAQFFHTQKHGPRLKPEQRAEVGLQQRLAPYKVLDEHARVDEAFRDNWYAGAPLLLDIALRCVPTPTLRHRMNEKPWVEFLFASVVDCVDVAEKDVPRTHETLVKMLSVVGRRAKLATETLRDLVRSSIFKSNEPLGSRSKSDDGTIEAELDASQERLLHKVIELDASVFLDKILMRQLCDYIYITGCDVDPALASGSGGEETLRHTSALKSPSVLREAVLVPVVRTYAREKRLLEIWDIWYGELKRCENRHIAFAWAGIGDTFALLMEASLTERQILDLVGRFSDACRLVEDEDEAQPTLRPTFTVLRAIFFGVRSDKLIQAVHDRAGVLLANLVELLEQTEDALPRLLLDQSDIWSLCTILFELWYPTYVQSDRSAHEKRAEKIFSSAVVRRVAPVASNARLGLVEHGAVGEKMREAYTFLACLSRYLGNLKSCELSQRAVLRIFQDTGDKAMVSPGIIMYPSMVMDLDVAQRKMLFGELLLCAIQQSRSGDSSFPAMRAMCGMTHTLAIPSVRILIEETILAALQQMETIDCDKGQHRCIVQVLNGLPSSVLSKAQAATIVESVTTIFSKSLDGNGADVRLSSSLIIRLLADKAPVAKICTDTTAYWQFVEAMDASSGESIRHDAGLYELSTLLSRLLAKQLLANQSHEGCCKMLHDLAFQIKQRIADLHAQRRSGRVETGICTLAFITGTWQEVSEQASEDLKSLFIPQRVVEDLVDTLVSVSVTNPKDGLEQKGAVSAHVAIAFSSLQKLLQSLDMEDNRVLREGIVQTMDQSEHLQHLSSLATLSFVRPVGDARQIADQILHLMGQELPPQEFSRVITHFRDICGLKLTMSERTTVIYHLLFQAQSRGTTHALTLLRSALPGLEKSAFEENPTLNISSILQKTLHIGLNGTSTPARCGALDCLIMVLREKPFLTNQFTIESTGSTLLILASDMDAEGAVFLRLCRTVTLLFQQYRSRFSDRMHLIVAILQALISRLFQIGRSESTITTTKPLTSRHAYALARCLQLFCKPPPSRPRAKSVTHTSLIDSSRRAQSQVGQYVPQILHHYCTQVLSGSTSEDVRETLTEGVWAMIEAMEVSDVDAMKVLSAAMNASERAVLRGVYERWGTGGRWSGS